MLDRDGQFNITYYYSSLSSHTVMISRRYSFGELPIVTNHNVAMVIYRMGVPIIGDWFPSNIHVTSN